MTNREVAEKIYEQLKAKGVELGNASIFIIAEILDGQYPAKCHYCGASALTTYCTACGVTQPAKPGEIPA